MLYTNSCVLLLGKKVVNKKHEFNVKIQMIFNKIQKFNDKIHEFVHNIYEFVNKIHEFIYKIHKFVIGS